MTPQIQYSCIVCIVIVGLIFLSNYGSVGTNKYDKHTVIKCKQLLRQVKHWYFTAQQDNDPLLALLHAHTSVVKLHTLTVIMNTHDISQLLKVDINALSRSVKELESNMLTRLSKQYPDITINSVLTSDHDWYI
jgi:hypothetical protein